MIHIRILVYADPHWSVTSSIIRSRGKTYSTRLENLITSLNWVEDLAREKGCEAVVCLGDFFDTAQLNSEEITALGEIAWSDGYHYFIAGNHEMGRSDSSFSSSTVFDLCPRSVAVTHAAMLPIYDQVDTRIMCLPYILEKDRKTLREYIDDAKVPEGIDNLIIFSHNDIKGIQMGAFVSTSGFSVEEIQANCRMFVNGHLHNGCEVAPGIINLGNLTGQNFSENAFTYKHNVMFLDTATHEVEWIENPHAFKFYKIDISTYDSDQDKRINGLLRSLGSPSVVTIKANQNNELFVKDLVSNLDNIIESRILVDRTSVNSNVEVTIDSTSTDHIKKFISYITENLGSGDLIMDELMRVGGLS